MAPFASCVGATLAQRSDAQPSWRRRGGATVVQVRPADGAREHRLASLRSCEDRAPDFNLRLDRADSNPNGDSSNVEPVTHALPFIDVESSADGKRRPPVVVRDLSRRVRCH